MTAKQLYDITIEIFGNRNENDQAPTAALGVIKKQVGVYAAVQGKVIRVDQFEQIHEALRSMWDVEEEQVVDSRELAQTARKKSEWTGYHAEALVLSAMISANVWRRERNAVRAALAECGGAIITANATACKHCGFLMDDLGIEYYGDKGAAGLTGWWNPITDGRYPQASHEFASNIPGF